MGADEQRQHEAAAKLAGHLGAAAAGAEHPELRHAAVFRHQADAVERVLWRQVVVQVTHQVEHLTRVKVRVDRLARVGQGRRGLAIAARRAAHAQIDAARVEHFQHAEGLGHFVRRVVRQHDAAAADPDAPRVGGDVADQDFRAGAGVAGRVVVFGQPVAVIAEALAGLCQAQAVVRAARWAAAIVDGGLVGDAQFDGHGSGCCRVLEWRPV